VSLTTPEKIRTLQKKLYLLAKEKPEQRFHSLYDKVYREDIIEHAYAICRANGGAPGVDGTTFAMIESAGRAGWLAGLRKELHEKTYEPQAVCRVMIPKPDGGERPLGIPTIRDRVVQTAAKLVLEPIFEADFAPEAYGYRPKKDARQAVVATHEALIDGYTDVVDADLSKFFDTIPHAELMRSVLRRVVDRQMLKLVKAWLKVPVEETDANGWTRLTGGKDSDRGTPQGGVISPLLANIYMHRFIRAWRKHDKGTTFEARLINYADDFVILSRRKAREALEWTRGVMARIGLTINEKKTRLCDARREPFNFLGYTFGPDRYRKTGKLYTAAKPSKRAVLRLKERLRTIVRRQVVAPWEEVRDRLNQVLVGWANYFSHGTKYSAYRAIDNFVQDRVRRFLRCRHKMSTRGIKHFPDYVIFGSLGVTSLVTVLLGRPSARRKMMADRKAGCVRYARPV
jgi:RNA-directed DNA polymerase